MAQRYNPTGQIGNSGLPRYSGYVFDEWLPELQGERGMRVLREMQDNDPIVGAVLFALEALIRQVDFRIDPGTDDQAGHDAAMFVDECLNDMQVTWADQLSEILTFLPYGFAFHELVYKRRDGKGSKHGDGKIGWYGWPLRAQETAYRWEFGDQGEILAMVQLGPPDYIEHTIPMEKGLLFRTSVRRGNPTGRSVLRSAYTSYYFKKRVQIFEGIGVERDLAGFPYMRIPGNILGANAEQNPIEYAALQQYIKGVTNIKRDEQEGLILPSDVDPQTGKDLYTFELVSSGGARQFDTDAIIARYDQRIAMTVMADFIMLGHEKVGSNALAQQKGSFFSDALGAWLQSICGIINGDAIPRLLRLNGMDTANPPTLEHGDIQGADVATLGALLANLATAGFALDTSAGGDLLADVLAKAKLPQPPDPQDIDVTPTPDTTDTPAQEPPKPEIVEPKAAHEPDDPMDAWGTELDAFLEQRRPQQASRNGHAATDAS